MRCWNCNRPVAKEAKVCAHCEADLTEAPSSEERAAALGLLEQLPPEILAELDETFRASTTAEDFVNRIMVGPCPHCHSDQTSHCEDDPEINELLVGRCYECGQLWCTECGQLLEPKTPRCPCWEEEE
jgi:hypothetical protein